jgi:hypothetical protein
VASSINSINNRQSFWLTKLLRLLQVPDDDNDNDEGSLVTLARQRQAALAAREELQREVAGMGYGN